MIFRALTVVLSLAVPVVAQAPSAEVKRPDVFKQLRLMGAEDLGAQAMQAFAHQPKDDPASADLPEGFWENSLEESTPQIGEVLFAPVCEKHCGEESK